ncbi:hypothetical protein BYT27DRAFT_7255327 [Phlegmacium glaucopus]|nr:hypothetical protein BYT27DRAFT_7255327 [Phlegmacium glaucopus]
MGIAPSCSDAEHSPSDYSGSYPPSLSDSISRSLSDVPSYEPPEFGIFSRQLRYSSTPLPATVMHLSKPNPQDFHGLQEYAARLEKKHLGLEKQHEALEQKHLLLETQHKMLR